jgi:hypothetical protein
LQFWYLGCENQLRRPATIVFGRIVVPLETGFVWEKFLILESVLLNPFVLNNNTNWNGFHIVPTLTRINSSQKKERNENCPTLVLSSSLLVLKVSEISETNCSLILKTLQRTRSCGSLILKTLQRTRTCDSLILEYSKNHTTLEKSCVGP